MIVFQVFIANYIQVQASAQHTAFVRGRSTCQLQQSISVGRVVCVFVGASAGGGAVCFHRRVCLGPLIGLTA